MYVDICQKQKISCRAYRSCLLLQLAPGGYLPVAIALTFVGILRTYRYPNRAPTVRLSTSTMDSTVSTVKIRSNDSVVSSSFLQDLDFSSGSSDQCTIVVGSVPHRGIRKIAGTTAASANGPLLQGRP